MSEYDFRSLSPSDFELLVRDVLNADQNLRLHAFPAGKDGGIDLRDIDGSGFSTIVQCKHYVDSSPSDFDRAIRKEKTKPALGQAGRYILATSHKLSPSREIEVARELGIRSADVWGPGKINRVLTNHREIEERHFKLWLASTTALSHIVNAGLWQRTEALVADAHERARSWVDVPAHPKAHEVLEREGVCILTGLAGVGKTHIADRLMLDALREDWRVADLVGDLTEAWAAARTPGKLLFYFDDFLGESELRLDAVGAASDLVNFIEYISKNKEHKRLVMTTRSQVLNLAAQSSSDRLRTLATQWAERIVAVSTLEPAARAGILINHLHFSGLPAAEREALEIDTRFKALVLNPSFNPRLVRLVTKSDLSAMSADEVLRRLTDAFANPVETWRATYSALGEPARDVLLTLATFPERAVLHRDLKAASSPGMSVLAWKDVLRPLEPTWIKIIGTLDEISVAFANPGCRDFLVGELDDYDLASERLEHRLDHLEQVISLSQSAGLLTADPAIPATLPRPNLTAALLKHKALLVSRIQVLWDDWLRRASRSSGSILLRLCDVGALLTLYAQPHELGWFADMVNALISGFPMGQLECVGALRLARQLSTMTLPEELDRASFVSRLVTVALGCARTLRDLDSYEDLPEMMRTEAIQFVAAQRAQRILQDEAEEMALDADDASALHEAVNDLIRRAEWYDVEIDVVPLLDVIDERAS